MSTTEPVDREQIARDFRTQMEGELDPAQLDAAAAAITAPAQQYPATLSIDRVGRLLVQVTGGETFTGETRFPPMGGSFPAWVYTPDVQRLYRETTRFVYTVTPVYLSLVFFDDAATVLGTCQAGVVSLVSGTGSGPGSWS